MASLFGMADGWSQVGIFLGYQCRKPGGTYSVCRKNRSSPFGRTISCFASMAKMPHSCEDHRQPSLIRGCDHLIVADGTAGLDHGCRACLHSCQQPNGEWEEGVGCDRITNRQGLVPTRLIRGGLGLPGSGNGRL